MTTGNPIFLPAERDSEALLEDLRLTLDQTRDGLMLVEAQPLSGAGPRVLLANHGMGEITGWGVRQLPGMTMDKLTTGPYLAGFLQRLPLVAETGRRYHTDMPVLRADGTTELCRWFLKAGCRGADGQIARFLIGVHRLVPAVEAAAPPPPPANPPPPTPTPAPLPESGVSPVPAPVPTDLRAERLQAIAQVACGIAHDFNNALAAVLSGISLAEGETDHDARQERLREALASGESARLLARRLLGYARGTESAKREPIDPVEIAREAIGLAQPGSNIHWDLKASGHPGHVLAEPVPLLQILANLLVNARQSMPEGGTVEVTVARRELVQGIVPECETGSYVEWTVRDRGIGIPAEDLPRLFDPYFSTRKEGTGLGLATSLAIARDHAGTITVKSAPGAGSTFRVLLPVATDEEIQAAAGPPDEPVAEDDDTLPVPQLGHVIVADDHDAVRDALRRQLERQGLTVLVATTGHSSVRLYRETIEQGIRPLAVFLDLTFPGGMTGEEAAAAILEEDPTAFLVACSGYLTDLDSPPADVGFAAGLPKPYTLKELRRCLRQAGAHLLRHSPFSPV